MDRRPAVHRRDAARLFPLALAHPEAGLFHAVVEPGVALREIAEVIGRRFDLPVESMAAGDAPGQFDWFAPFVGLDAPTSSARTSEATGWAPKERGLLADLADPAYFVG